MEDLLIYSKANTVFEMKTGTVASLPIPEGQHTMEGFTIKGWLNLKILTQGQEGIDKKTDFLVISPYVDI